MCFNLIYTAEFVERLEYPNFALKGLEAAKLKGMTL